MQLINKNKIETLVHSKIRNVSPKAASEIAKKIYFGTPDKTLSSNKDEVVFQNGKYNIKTREFIEGDFESLNKIPWDYNHNAKSKLGKELISRYVGNNIGFDTQIFEVLGIMMFQDKDMGFKKTIFFDGPSDYAKSFLTERLLQPVLGSHNYTQIDSNDLNPAEFAKLINRTAAFDDDMDRGQWSTKSVSNFKKVTGSTKLKAKMLYIDVFDFINYATLWINCNGLPEFKDTGSGGALDTRMHVIKATVNIRQKYHDPDIYQKVEEHQKEISEWLIAEAIQALAKAIDRGSLTETQISKETLRYNNEEKNPVVAWMQQYDWDNCIKGKRTSELFNNYNASFNNTTDINYGKANGVKIKTFTRVLRDNAERMNIKIYVSMGYNKVRKLSPGEE